MGFLLHLRVTPGVRKVSTICCPAGLPFFLLSNVKLVSTREKTGTFEVPDRYLTDRESANPVWLLPGVVSVLLILYGTKNFEKNETCRTG